MRAIRGRNPKPKMCAEIGDRATTVIALIIPGRAIFYLPITPALRMSWREAKFAPQFRSEEGAGRPIIREPGRRHQIRLISFQILPVVD